MRKMCRMKQVENRRELRRIEAEAREQTRALHEDDPVLLDDKIRELTAQKAVVQGDRFVVWGFDLTPQGRPVEACDTPLEAVQAARRQQARQGKNVSPGIQFPGGKWWPEWPIWEGMARRGEIPQAELESRKYLPEMQGRRPDANPLAIFAAEAGAGR